MVDSRLRVNPPSLFHCFAYVVAPGKNDGFRIRVTVPEEFEEKEATLKSIPEFCFPCAINHDGVQYSTFVLTDLDSRFKFGFCRYPPYANHCLCIVSSLPWFHTFYAVLDKVAFISAKDNTFQGITKFLEALNKQSIPQLGSKLYFTYNDGSANQSFKVTIPDTRRLPSIPEDRNLTEYFAKVTPENMVNLFISMLFERRIIITSDKLSVLTAVVHGSVSLLYPMQWQHIYIPVLPAHLIDYCCAPMPFLLGVHASMMEKVNNMPLSEVVIFDADTNEITMLQEDVDSFPSRISSRLKKKLRHMDRALQDYVAKQFLNALADLIGGYKEALKYIETDKGERIVFDDDLFLTSRTGSTKVFLEQILDLQSFRQFVACRLELMNDDQAIDDMFENAINQRTEDIENETKYSHFKDRMKKSGGAIKKGGAAFKKSVDGSYSQLKGMAQDIDTKEFKKKIKDKVKDGYKGVKQIAQKDSSGDEKKNSPLIVRRQTAGVTSRAHLQHSVHAHHDIPHPKRPPPRPPRPASEMTRPLNTDHTSTSTPCSTTEMPRKLYGNERTSSHSETDLHTLVGVHHNTARRRSGGSNLGTESSFESLDYYSETDSSAERLEEGYQNPAFVDKNTDLLFSLSGSEEDVALEHSSLVTSPPQLQPYERHVKRFPSPIGTNQFTHNDHDDDGAPDNNTLTPQGGEQQQLQHPPSQMMKKFDTTCGPFYTPSCELEQVRKHPPSIIRKKPVTGKKPSVPPRPKGGSVSGGAGASNSTPTSPSASQRPTVPVRPASLRNKNKTSGEGAGGAADLIFESDSPTDVTPNIADLTFEDDEPSAPNNLKRHNVTPNTSPLPSSDLLGLEQSLFHETMNSLSPDARSLMTSSSSSSSSLGSSGFNDSFNNRNSGTPNYQLSVAATPNYNPLIASNYRSITTPNYQQSSGATPTYRPTGTPNYQLSGTPNFQLSGTPNYQLSGTANYRPPLVGTPTYQASAPNFQASRAFFETRNNYPNYNANNFNNSASSMTPLRPVPHQAAPPQQTSDKVVNSTRPDDLFANCYAEARHEFSE